MSIKNNKLKFIGGIIILLIVITTIYFIIKDKNNIDSIRTYVEAYGNLAPLVYIIMFSLVPLTFFPDSILAITGGVVFGLVNGYIYTTIGAIIGSTISFFISRFLGKSFVSKFLGEKMSNIEKLIKEKGFFMVLLLRLIPIFPFDLISYGAGLTIICYKDYLIATFIGTIPGILVFTNIGAQWINIGQSTFYLSIALFICLLILSLILKRKYFVNN